MATTKQIDANRQNAQRSTGPRTPEGKDTTRFNALKSGIDAQAEVIPGEDPGRLETLIAEYQERFDASTPERRMLVDTLVNCEWMLRRMRRGEAQFWKFRDSKTITETDYPEGRILDYGDKVYDRIQRRLNSIHRNYHRALNELQRLEDAATADASDQPPEIPAPPPEPPVTSPTPTPPPPKHKTRTRPAPIESTTCPRNWLRSSNRDAGRPAP
jgi:hypothetical protein